MGPTKQLTQSQKDKILELAAKGETIYKIAIMVDCTEGQVSYVKKKGLGLQQKDTVVSVSIEGPSWDTWAGSYFLIQCETQRGLTVRVCRTGNHGNYRTQKTRAKGLLRKFSEVLIGHEIEFYIRGFHYIAKYAKLPEELKAFVPNSTFSKNTGPSFQ